jgi:hypothetical protein
MMMANKQEAGRASEEGSIKQNMEITDTDMRKILKTLQVHTQNFHFGGRGLTLRLYIIYV